MKTKLLARAKWILSLSAMLSAVLLICYGAFAQTGRARAQRGNDKAAARVSSAAQIPDSFSQRYDENNPEFVKKRREWLDRFFGLGTVSPAAYARALAAARAAPISPLLGGRQFAPTTPAVQPWTSPIPPPILNSWGDATTRIQALGLAPGLSYDVVYTGSFGGVAKSANNGDTWQYLSNLWNSQAISCITVDSNPNYIYVGTGMDLGNSAPLFAEGLYRSSDAGTNWLNIGGTEFRTTFIRAVAVGPSGTVYVGNARSHSAQYPPGLWRSTNSGVSWALKHRAGDHDSGKEWNGIHDVAVDRLNPSKVYIADDDEILRSTDDGNKWYRLGNPLPSGGWGTRLSVVNSVPYALAGADDNRKLYKYNGTTWVEIQTQSRLAVFAVDPNNTQVIIGGDVDLYRTTNEGATWSPIASNVHIDHRIIAFSPYRSGTVYNGNDGGIVKSTDDGQNWANLNHNFPGAWLYDVELSRDGTMIAGTQDTGVVFSDPLAPWGRAWDSVDTGDSVHNLIDPNDGATGYRTLYGDQSQGFWRFNRATPHDVTNIRPSQFDEDCACNFFPTFSMNPSSPTHLIAACQRLVRTLDATASPTPVWTTIGNGPLPSPSPCENWNTITAAAEAPNNSDVIYAVTHYDTVFVTTNAGAGNNATWQQITPQNQPGGIHAVTVDPTDYRIAYLACDDDVYKIQLEPVSVNDTGFPDNLIYRDMAIKPANPQSIFAASRDGVLVSTNGGDTWANMSAGSIPAGMVISGLSFNSISLQLAAATVGRGVYVIDLDDVPPTVSITSPVNGATVSGSVTISATASDNHNVVGVRFKVDGADIGPEVTSPPYSIGWNTTLWPNGTHKLTAVARDPAGNIKTSLTVTVNVSNP